MLTRLTAVFFTLFVVCWMIVPSLPAVLERMQ
jgi:preprotein translocase subunit SecG